jgi:hypothetical protein
LRQLVSVPFMPWIATPKFVQLPVWPCDEAAIRQHAFAGAYESFLLAVVKDAQSTTSIEAQ